MATKLETTLSAEFIFQLRTECSKRGERIKVIKIHGGPFQTLGISDYLGWYMGTGFGMEMKVDNNTVTEAQQQFLNDIVGTGNIGIVVTFRKGATRNNPYAVFTTAFLNVFKGTIYTTIVGY